ncbi:MAG: hypothetical protein TREMPRED_003744 [Tremellales sp. Tagirdzhanova-0007]|nr:MAG: hypothetical protein TREMPRED_003744 [Tremellales sp. Tagirdzhanova-0007]
MSHPSTAVGPPAPAPTPASSSCQINLISSLTPPLLSPVSLSGKSPSKPSKIPLTPTASPFDPQGNSSSTIRPRILDSNQSTIRPVASSVQSTIKPTWHARHLDDDDLRILSRLGHCRSHALEDEAEMDFDIRNPGAGIDEVEVEC